MKKLLILIVGLFFSSCFHPVNAQNYDYLKSVNATGNGITTDNSQAWTDLFSVSIDVTNVSYVLVTASMNMRVDGSNTGAREANYNIYRDGDISDKSGIVKRQIKAQTEADVKSWGIGTLVHLFDVVSLSGSQTYTLQHANMGGTGLTRNVASYARLTAVALNTASSPYYELSNSGKRLDADVTTASSTYEVVTGLTTDAITLPIKGDIFVLASINVKANGTCIAEYKLEYSTDGGNNWADLGMPVDRSMVNTWDDGIISLVGLLQDQNPDNDFKFRVAHKRVSGTATVTTHSSNLVAIALAHEGGGSFPSFYSEVGATGVDITGISATPAIVTSSEFTSALEISSVGTNLFVASQYLVSASGLDQAVNPDQRMRSGNYIYVSGATSGEAEEYFRYTPDNTNFGSCGFIGLMENLASNGSHFIGMKHEVNYISNPDVTEDETLTTSEVILCGFQTYDQPGYLWCGDTDSDWDDATNWEYDAAPAIASDITIPTSPTSPAIINASTSTAGCNDLFINGGSLVIEDDGNFDVDGDLYNNGGTLTLESTATGTGSLIIAGTATGNAIVQRYLPDGSWHLVSPSTTGVTANDFYWNDSPMAWLLWHDESKLDDASWNYNTDLATSMPVGQGWMVWLDANTKSTATASMTGTLRVTTFSPTLDFTDANHGWNLLGNPFSSAIDYDEGTWGTNTTGFIYVWDNDKNAPTGDYVLSGTDLTGSIIPLGQGFFVDATSSAAFDIPAAARVHSAQNFWKSTNDKQLPKMIKIQLDGENCGNTVFVGFPDNGTSGTDYAGDARKMYSSTASPQLFAVENNIELCVNSIETLSADNPLTTVPLSLVQVIDGNYSLSISQIDQLPDTEVTLEDIKTGAIQDIVTNNVYSFSASSNDAPARFLLHFQYSPNGVGSSEASDDNVHIYAYDNSVYVRTKDATKIEVGEIIIYDLYGRAIIHQQLPVSNIVRIPLGQNHRFVVVKVIKNHRVYSKKVFIK